MDKSYIGACAKPVRNNVHPVSRGWISSADALTENSEYLNILYIYIILIFRKKTLKTVIIKFYIDS